MEKFIKELKDMLLKANNKIHQRIKIHALKARKSKQKSFEYLNLL